MLVHFLKVEFVKKEEITVEENKNNKSCYNKFIKEQRLLAIYGSKTIQFLNISIVYNKDKYVDGLLFFEISNANNITTSYPVFY
jgi:hypothetical protein